MQIKWTVFSKTNFFGDIFNEYADNNLIEKRLNLKKTKEGDKIFLKPGLVSTDLLRTNQSFKKLVRFLFLAS